MGLNLINILSQVTIESFLAWKAEFDRERLEKKGVKVLTGKEKLTGQIENKHFSLNLN